MFTFLAILVFNFIALEAVYPDNYTIVEHIKKFKYPVEVHTVETEDGYVLKLHRIPRGDSSNKLKNVVFFAHGMGGSAENWLLLGAPDALGFYFSDKDYDVWMFNARGTVHSRKHRSLNPDRDRRKFWDFSWHEIAINDLPATINYVLKKTGQDKLFYIGHSQGTTTFYVMMSEKPEMNEKLKVAALITPSVLLNYTHSPLIRMLSRFAPLGQRLLSMFSWYEMVIPNSPSLNRILEFLCKPKSMSDVCMDVLSLGGGTDSGYVNKTYLPLFIHFCPSGFSFRQMIHYAQVIDSGEFKQFDFGKKKNIKLYNSTKPPLYNLSKAVVPIGHFYAEMDPFANEKMMQEMAKVVPNIALEYKVEHDAFNHIDFAVASKAKEWVYDPLYAFFQQYEDNN